MTFYEKALKIPIYEQLFLGEFRHEFSSIIWNLS